MALKVIGTGLGRTGTMSLKLALEELGLGPCHHMVEVFMHPESMPLWVAAGAGEPDWEAICAGYQSMVDYPGCKFWRQLMDHYPDAKLIHSVRDPEAWFESTQATIFAPDGPSSSPPEPLKDFFGMVMSDFGGRQNDHDFMTDFFKRHTDEVLSTVPADRLIVFEATQGWEPLCAFLGVPVPDKPFPKHNTREEFQARATALKSGAAPDPAHIRAVIEEAKRG